ncbi:MAG: PIG-L deacetylase family protein [Bacteroidota bacterium]|nr:PIG-L deacetylase family protein [Bacteroidota bacterium]
MLTINFNKDAKAPLKILFLGAHSDDIEIGCGGTILKLAKQYKKNLEIVWVVFSAQDEREREALKSANSFLKDVEQKRIITFKHRDGFFPFTAIEIKESFESIKKNFSPDIVFTHYRNDRHQDHRLISDLTWNTFRNHLIFEYEIPKYDGDFGSPNFFVALDEKICKKRNDFIIKHFQTQKEKHWLTKETLLSVLRLRGIESGRSSRYAEGFYCRKIAL